MIRHDTVTKAALLLSSAAPARSSPSKTAGPHGLSRPAAPALRLAEAAGGGRRLSRRQQGDGATVAAEHRRTATTEPAGYPRRGGAAPGLLHAGLGLGAAREDSDVEQEAALAGRPTGTGPARPPTPSTPAAFRSGPEVGRQWPRTRIISACCLGGWARVC